MADRTHDSDLALPAIDLLARNALDALRGPMSRGAVPTAELAKSIERPRSTVARLIDRETGNPGATAFDLVARYAFCPEHNGQQPKWEGALHSYVAHQGPPVLKGETAFAEPAMKKMLGDGFTETATGDARALALVGYLLHVAAMLNRDSGVESCASAAILEMRRDSYARSTAIYASAMRFIFSATRRRPKGDRSVEDIVVMTHSLFDGYLIRHALDPELHPIESLVDTIWDLVLALTEPGFLAERDGDSLLRDDLIQHALDVVRKEHVMLDPAELAEAVGQDRAVVSSEFADAEQLAEACLERTCRHAFELCALSDETAGIARLTLQGFMAWLASLVREYGPLVDATPRAKVWSEMSSLIDMMLMSAAPQLNPIKRKEIANRLLSVVRSGADWEPALSVLMHALNLELAAEPGVLDHS